MLLSTKFSTDHRPNTGNHMLNVGHSKSYMLLPGGCTCSTLGSCCSCSCGAISLKS